MGLTIFLGDRQTNRGKGDKKKMRDEERGKKRKKVINRW